MADDAPAAPLTVADLTALLFARAEATLPAGTCTGGGGISVQTDNTAGEIDNFASPTFKSLSMWFPGVSKHAATADESLRLGELRHVDDLPEHLHHLSYPDKSSVNDE